MKARLAPITALLMFMLFLEVLAPAQTTPRPARHVAAFSRLETKVEDAFKNSDLGTLNRILSSHFEIWTPNRSLAPIARDEWLQTATELRPSSFRIRDMSVRTFGNMHVVMFKLDETVGGDAQSHFIVDVWKGMNNSATLQVRYEAPAPGPGAVKPVGEK